MKIGRLVRQIEEAALERKAEMKQDYPSLFSTGCTEFNLACSDRMDGAFAPGTMINIIGDSFAGKTYVAHSILAEAAINPVFSKYRFVYDNTEAAYSSAIMRMFGKALLKRIEPPTRRGCSGNIEEFKANVLRALEGKRPCIYVLDSFDSLISKDQEKRDADLVDGKELRGSYGAALNAKELKSMLRSVIRKLNSTRSLLIIVSQTIHKIGMVFGNPKTRTGGEALLFFASHEIWLGLREKIKVKINGRDRSIGSRTHVSITKNKLTGKCREADFCIYQDYGIDDIGSCIDFMVKEKLWKKTGEGRINAREDFGIVGTQKELVKHVEKNDLERRLRSLVRHGWEDIEDRLRLKRKPRYL